MWSFTPRAAILSGTAVLAMALPSPVVAASAPTLTIAHPPSADSAGPSPKILWTTGNAAPGLVTVRLLGAPKEQVVATGESGQADAPWIQEGHEYTFRLYATAPRRKLLVRVVLGRGTQNVLQEALPDDPTDTPPAVDRLLQVAPYGLGLLVLVLSTAYLRSLRG